MAIIKKTKRRKKIRKDSDNPVETSLKDQTSPELLAKIERYWLDGMDAEQLAQRFGFDAEQLDEWIKGDLLNKHRSRYERIGMVFDKLFTACDMAHKTYQGRPTCGNSQAYGVLVNQLRGAMVDLDNVQTNEEVADDILKLALNPLIRKVSQVLIDELGNFKEELMTKFDEDDADRLVNEVVERCGSHFKSAIDDSCQRLEGILGARDKNKSSAAAGATKSKKRGHLKSVPTGG